jgi:hypothetical protein
MLQLMKIPQHARLVCDICKETPAIVSFNSSAKVTDYADANLYLCHGCEVLLWQSLAADAANYQTA